MSASKATLARIEALREEIRQHNYLYHVLDAPEVHRIGAQEAIAGGDEARTVPGRVAMAKEATAAAMADWDAAEREAAIEIAPAGFWLSASPEELARRLKVYAAAKKADPPLVIEVWPTPEGDATEVVVATPDHPGLFARIAGGLALAGVDIVQSQAATFTDGFVLDVFAVASDPSEAGTDRRDDRIVEAVRAALSGEVKPNSTGRAPSGAARMRSVASVTMPSWPSDPQIRPSQS